MMQTRDSVLTAFEMGPNDTALLRDAWKIIEPTIETILDSFYGKLTNDARMMDFFDDQNSLDRARNRQIEHWKVLFDGVFDESYFASAEKVGRVHFRIDLPFLDYTAGYAKVANTIQDTLIDHFVGVLPRKTRLKDTLRAVSNIIYIDMQAATEAYMRAANDEREQALGEMRAAIEDMRRGNLERRIAQSAAFPEKFDTLRFSFNDLADKLTLVFGQIGRSAQNVHESSENVTQTSDSLSQRTSDQLTSLEQASVSIREMLEIVEETEALVNTVKESSSNNAASAQAGSGVIDEARSAMTKIKEASDKIRSIVDVIDDISFQTNLLALNAGVEAARAGEAGRGFAVVASEVGALAQRSAESASSIRALILDSTKIVEEGSDLMEASADSLRAIRENAATVDEGIEKIRSAATSQSSSLRDIDESISEIERASAGNADTANLVNQNCGELRKEADRLGDPFDLFARASASWGGEELKPARDRPVAA